MLHLRQGRPFEERISLTTKKPGHGQKDWNNLISWTNKYLQANTNRPAMAQSLVQQPQAQGRLYALAHKDVRASNVALEDKIYPK